MQFEVNRIDRMLMPNQHHLKPMHVRRTARSASVDEVEGVR